MRLATQVTWVFLLLVLLPRTAGAWGALGHQVIADLAQDMLTPAARARASALLGPPTAGGAGGAGFRLSAVSTWADDIKSLRPETRAWHYVTLQVAEPRYDAAKADSPNVVTALKRSLGVLGDASADRYAREEALKWVVHLVGDLHQPLHVGEDRDRGGNLHKVKVGRRTRNLHEVWDYVLLERLNLPADTLRALIRRDIAADAAWRTRIAGGTVEQWVDETHALSRGCYLLHGRPMRKGIASSLDRSYLRPNTWVVLGRLKTASVRLARVLNAALDPAAPPVPPAPVRAAGRADTAAYFAAAAGDPDVETSPAERGGASASAKYFWSVNSTVYHLAGCADIARIKQSNLRGGDVPPPGLSLHAGCPRKP